MAGKQIDNASLDESLSQYEKAVQHYQLQMDSARKVGDKAGEGTAYGNLGGCYYFLGQYDKALEHHEKRLTIAKEIGDKKGKAAAYGEIGVCYRALGQYSKAIAHQKMRVTIAKQIEDKEGEGAAYGDLGICYREIGQYSKAIEHQEMRLTIAKQFGDKAGEGAAYGNLGLCYHSLGLFRKALDYHEMSRTIAELIGDKIDEQSCYSNLAVCHHSLGQYDKAIENQEKGLAIARELGDKAGEGTAYGNLGGCYYVRGQYYKAIQFYLMALTIAKQTGAKSSECSAHGNLGASFRALGKFDIALEHHEICLAIAKEIGDRAGEGSAHGYLGTCYYSLGQYAKAAEHFQMRLTIAEQIGDKKGEGTAYGNLCACYYSLGEYEKAIENNMKHLKIAEQIEDKAGEGVVYGNLGACYRDLGQYSRAAEFHGKSLVIAKQIGNKKSEAIACRSLGACYACSADDHSKAIKYYNMSLTIAQQIGDTEVEGAAYASLGAYYNSRCQYDKAESNCTKSIECHERLFENAPKQDQFKVSIVDTFITTYNLLLRILLIQGKREEALVLAERGHSRALADLIRTIHPVTCGDATESKILDFHEICNVVTALESTVLYFRLLSPEICTWVIQPNDDLLFQRTCGRDSTQEFISDVQSLNLLIAKSRELIRSSTVECEDRSLSFLYEEQNMPNQTKNKERPVSSSPSTSAVLSVSKPGLPQDGTPFPTTTQSECVTASSRRLAEREHYKSEEESQEPTLTSLLKDMYQIVLAPVQQFVKGPAVAVIPDGPIAMVPFAALVDSNENYVAESLQIRLVPSLATAKMIKERSQELKGEASPLIVGEPDVGVIEVRGQRINVPKLPYARKEAEIIGALLNVQPLTAEKATKRNFLQRFESARLIHIAAHGDIERGEILFASSRGSDRRNVDDVMLRTSDLEGKCTAAKLVVLSCCHSGRGEVRAEGVIGIARAFLGAGAAAVLVALWAVNDEATLYFMRKFYQHLFDGKRASEALGVTMKVMRETETFRHPRYWAPFVLIGEDVAPFECTVE